MGVAGLVLFGYGRRGVSMDMYCKALESEVVAIMHGLKAPVVCSLLFIYTIRGSKQNMMIKVSRESSSSCQTHSLLKLWPSWSSVPTSSIAVAPSDGCAAGDKYEWRIELGYRSEKPLADPVMSPKKRFISPIV
ncbi:hypothetical protein J3F84DRAFT_32760 [Trichoderma pleuroticola]